MRSTQEDAFCPNCEWTGDATGVSSCPVCGSNLSSLRALDEDVIRGEKDKYPQDFVSKIQEADDDYIE